MRCHAAADVAHGPRPRRPRREQTAGDRPEREAKATASACGPASGRPRAACSFAARAHRRRRSGRRAGRRATPPRLARRRAPVLPWRRRVCSARRPRCLLSPARVPDVDRALYGDLYERLGLGLGAPTAPRERATIPTCASPSRRSLPKAGAIGLSGIRLLDADGEAFDVAPASPTRAASGRGPRPVEAPRRRHWARSGSTRSASRPARRSATRRLPPRRERRHVPGVHRVRHGEPRAEVGPGVVDGRVPRRVRHVAPRRGVGRRRGPARPAAGLHDAVRAALPVARLRRDVPLRRHVPLRLRRAARPRRRRHPALRGARPPRPAARPRKFARRRAAVFVGFLARERSLCRRILRPPPPPALTALAPALRRSSSSTRRGPRSPA